MTSLRKKKKNKKTEWIRIKIKWIKILEKHYKQEEIK